MEKIRININRIVLFGLVMFCFCLQTYAAETIRMNIGENTTLRPSDLSSKTLAGQPSWTSSRPNDVVVESVTMYSCTIKAKKSFSGYALVQCVYYYRELDPYDPDHIHQRKGNINYHVFVSEQNPTSITIYPTDIVMAFGSTKQMSVTVSPSTANQTVTWTTTDRTVATVNDANILGANGYGTAVVTATTSNGLTASCTVTVKKDGDNGGNNGSNNDNSDNGGQNNTNYDELDYYFQIAKKRMNALRNIAIQQHKK